MHGLMRAARHGHRAVAKRLLGKGAAIAAENNRGRIALHGAAWAGHSEVVRFLLHNEANFEAENGI